MNGVHDMGGMDGFGPIVVERGEPVFHAPWEGRVFALTRAIGFAGLWTLDESRATQERLPPRVYLEVSYFKRWQLGFEKLLTKYGLVTEEELLAGEMRVPPKPLSRMLTKAIIPTTLRRKTFARPSQTEPAFKVGDQVRTKNMHPTGATRLPRYARGHIGRIERVQGCHVYPDSVVARNDEDPQWLYTLVFDACELWGDGADPHLKISIEAFEPYLEVLSTLGQDAGSHS